MAEGVSQEEAITTMADKNAMDGEVDEYNQHYLTGGVASQKKKSCFQITSVKVSENTNNDDAESMDELDESHAEDVSADLLDVSKNNSVDLDPSTEDLNMPAPEIINTEETLPPTVNGNHQGNGPSRFRVVKIETTEPIKRGRWACTDYLDPPEKSKEPKVETISAPERTIDKEPGSGNSSAASSVHYIAGQDPNTENPLGLPVSEQPPPQVHPQSSSSTKPLQQIPAQQQIPASQQNTAQTSAQPQGGNQGQEPVQTSAPHSHPTSIFTDYGTHSMMEHIRDSLNVNDMSSGAPSIDGQSEGEDSASGASVGAIDNKIEQAMDLVKSHLMYAVREEVEVLKEQIKELLERNSQLEKENNLLRQQQVQQQVVVAQQTAAPLQQQQQPQMQSTSTQSAEQPSVATQSTMQS